MNCANHPDRERVAFCQNCGKPLCSGCTRTVGTAVFCEPCLAARLAAADTTNSAAGAPYGNVNVPYGTAASAMPPVPGAPNPALAGLLGLIPGVGAMYNGQYAKGVVHLIVFAVLVSFADNNGLFGLFIAGWVFYQVFEAYHTARARRDGTPLPNPFGLNDIGDKLGFGKTWPTPPLDGSVPPTAPFTAAPPYASPSASYGPVPSGSQNFAPGGSPFAQGTDNAQAYGSYGNAGWGTPGGNYAPPIPPNVPYGAPFPPEVDLTQRGNRFPMGAILLIVFGLLFFFGSSGWFHGFPVQRVFPFLLIGVGVWIFVRKMTNTGLGVADDGSPGYRLRLVRALRSAIWVTLVGVLFFLDTFNILSWDHSWPLFIIVAGLIAILDRSAASTAASQQFGYASYPPSGSTPVAPAQAAPSTGTSIVPTTSHDEEGR